ncbi:copper homeostasis protein CutC [Frateuria defendens]|uniref:copper homeostasis protein CutC n=1 Tax=Frateuria defendens TaxID=2219559 RepID=UPI00066FB5BE|nr:copper homeostasis protein CutC [Frateuria defendens]
MTPRAAPAGLEVAADSLTSALAAQEGGAMRVELCGGLDNGGLTPSFGSIALAREHLRIPLHVLIRPRAGDFVYSPLEIEAMRRDIEQCVRLECDGIVVGALTPSGEVDLVTMRALIEAAGSLSVTFHRAIDVSRDPLCALEDVAALGCARVLTSGASATAIEGAGLIAELVYRAGERLVVMPGAGIDEHNLGPLRAATGAREFHASARSPAQGAAPFLPGLDAAVPRTDAARVRRMAAMLHGGG